MTWETEQLREQWHRLPTKTQAMWYEADQNFQRFGYYLHIVELDVTNDERERYEIKVSLKQY